MRAVWRRGGVKNIDWWDRATFRNHAGQTPPLRLNPGYGRRARVGVKSRLEGEEQLRAYLWLLGVAPHRHTTGHFLCDAVRNIPA